MIHTFADHTCKLLNEQKDTISNALIGGGAKTIEDYRQMTGAITGINFAIQTITDLAKAADRAE